VCNINQSKVICFHSVHLQTCAKTALALPDYSIIATCCTLLCKGKVFAATRKKDGKKCALKFFGYTNHRPVMKDINQEIRLMISLDQVEGVCQLLGVFDDTPTGLMPEKYSSFSVSYPVIVMEMLEGGDLFARISARRDVTENYLAVTFLSMVRALQSLHGRNFIHRDLKLGECGCVYWWCTDRVGEML
jgi:serine/threonine protein kinase